MFFKPSCPTALSTSSLPHKQAKRLKLRDERSQLELPHLPVMSGSRQSISRRKNLLPEKSWAQNTGKATSFKKKKRPDSNGSQL
jgi:hypothetical protein